MSGLWARTHTSPLETRYWSCVPYLLGEDQAMQYSLWLKSGQHEAACRACRCARRNTIFCVKTWRRHCARQDALFDFMIQLQIDAHRMPAENASVRWPEELSPLCGGGDIANPQTNIRFTGAARLRAPSSYNPWHLPRGPSPARKSEPRPQKDLSRAVAAAPGHEPDAPSRTDGATRNSNESRQQTAFPRPGAFA